ncbi:hypothetical protein MAIT1_01724 [Magnetofaba australis IT-1]|uniref:Uncharacterized protein n=2 Tax=Magnetofaba TaxID=1472292 RepID=A0A1Y2K3I6_9PROT|nr:type II secretion system protein [Magnetofaba australis]OSM01704.1 hypothetical protein MAIT1_01724 [Magnetofaba australis IT-1]
MTLFELIMVIAIIAILASVAVPKFLDTTSEAVEARVNNHYHAIVAAAQIAYQAHRAAQLSASGSGDATFIKNCQSLEIYLQGGMPDEVKCNGKNLTFEDGRKAKITQEESVSNAATISTLSTPE